MDGTVLNSNPENAPNLPPRAPFHLSSTRVYTVCVLMMLGLCFPSSVFTQTTLRIAAAADLQPVLPPILEQFQRSTGIAAQATYQASAALTTQIENGAPFDLFLSADLSYPQRLLDSDFAISTAENPRVPLTYARGTLVLFTRRDSRWPHPSVDTLRDPTLRHLAIANPDRAPYGRAALAALASLKVTASLRPKLVTAENVAQAAQFAESGNADAGLISLTAAITPPLASVGSYFLIPASLYPPIQQGAIILRKSTQPQNARRFLAFLLSPTVQQELARHGLTPVN